MNLKAQSGFEGSTKCHYWLICSISQMKSLPVSADSVTCLLTGLTRQRASPIFHQRVSQTSWTLYFCQHIDSTTLWWWVFACCAHSLFRMSNLSRICVPAVSRWELCSGPDRCLHSGGWQALPVCLQSHHQRQACELAATGFNTNLKIIASHKWSLF